jgi:serine O-acetyltransferase
MPHGAVGLVVHESTVIGRNVKLYQGVTLGRSDTHLTEDQSSTGGGIIVGDDVVVGAGAVVLFRSGETIRIGDRAVIGANSLVLKSVPSGEIWAGNPARKVADRPS